MEKQHNYCVYKHTNKVNGKVYIGLTGQKPEYRWNNGDGYKQHPHFYSAIKKYGWNNFDHEIVKNNLTQDEAQTLEINLISKYKSTDNKYGYNTQYGGNLGLLGYKHSEETKNKMSEGRKGDANAFYGKKHSLESKNKMSLAKSGKYCGEKSWNYGRHVSEDVRKKMSAAFKGRNSRSNSHFARKVYCVELHRIFDCVKDAKEFVGNNAAITASASDPSHKSTAGTDPVTKKPLHWIYCDELHLFSDRDLENIKTNRVPKACERDSLKIICLNNKKVFNNAHDAEKWCGLKTNSNICSCARGTRSYAGKDPINGKPLKWMKYNDYLQNIISLDVKNHFS